MSKSTNGLGQFRGKLGGVVYAVRNGQQIVRAYQPVVANPKSTEQRLQRAKGVLAGKLSHLITADIIIGMNGGSKSGRRSEFNRVLLDAIDSQISITTGTVKATLMPSRLLLSQGSAIHAINRASTSQVVYDAGQLVFSWNEGSWEGNVRFVAIVSYWNGTDYEWRVYVKVIDVASRQAAFALPASWEGSGNYMDVYGYAIPIIIDEETLTLNGTPLASSDSKTVTQYIASLVATESSALSYAESEFVDSAQLSL